MSGKTIGERIGEKIGELLVKGLIIGLNWYFDIPDIPPPKAKRPRKKWAKVDVWKSKAKKVKVKKGSMSPQRNPEGTWHTLSCKSKRDRSWTPARNHISLNGRRTREYIDMRSSSLSECCKLTSP